MAITERISPFLWFDGQATEAARFYVDIFPNSEILEVAPLPGGPAESNAMVMFRLDGQSFTALDGGPEFQFTPAISFVVQCEGQGEVDYYWDRLTAGGVAEQCGWLRDRFGVSWQVIPVDLGPLLAENPAAVMAAILEMEKIDLAALERAGRGR